MVALPSNLPPLDPADRSRLARFVERRFDLSALGRDLAAEGRPADLCDLLAWCASPAVQAWLAALEHLERLRHDALARDARAEALAVLRELLRSSDDPVERRRAASATLRHAAQPAPSSPRPPSPPKPPRRSGPIPSVALSPRDSARHALEKIFRALRANDEPHRNAGMASLHAALAPDAVINDQPVPADAATFIAQERRLAPIFDTVYSMSFEDPGPEPPSLPATRSIRFRLSARDALYYLGRADLRRDDDESPWRITGLELRLDDSG